MVVYCKNSFLPGDFDLIANERWILILLTQAWECTPGKEQAWNVLSLFTTSGMLFLEVSLLAFLLQGNHASGLQALTQTFVVSGLIVGFDILLKVYLAQTMHANACSLCYKSSFTLM